MKRKITVKFIWVSNSRGVIKLLIPRTKKMFKMLEPNTLPMAMPAFFLVAATMEVISSGREVAMATTVKPIRDSLMPRLLAMRWALLETNSPPRYSPPMPMTRKRMVFAQGIGIWMASTSSLGDSFFFMVSTR